MSNELKPCPMCGAHLALIWSLTLDGKGYTIKCTECPARVEGMPCTREQAIAAWNRRPAPAQGALPDALPELPKPDTHCYDEDTRTDVWSHSADQMRAYVLADRAIRAQKYTVSDAALDSKRLNHVYHLAMVEPFIAPVATKERWLESIDRSMAAAIQAQAGDATGGTL